MRCAKISLFLSDLFVGSAADHLIPALMNSPLAPSGLKLGVPGNWQDTFMRDGGHGTPAIALL